MGCHGRTANYPTAPAQIPAYGPIAPGSSEILASVKDKLVLIQHFGMSGLARPCSAGTLTMQDI